MSSIRITSCPVGEEPEHVRESWVGLEFPLTSLPVIIKQGFPGESGLFMEPEETYPVSFKIAMGRLDDAQRFEAVRWWRENHHAQFYSPDAIILFHESCCEYLP